MKSLFPSTHILLTVILLSALFSSNGKAEKLTKQERFNLGLSNFSYEVIDCAAYYAISAEGLNRGGKSGGAKKATEAHELLLGIANSITPQKTVLARLELSMNEQIDAVNGDYKNLSILIVRYGETCKNLVESPEKRMKYHINKVMAGLPEK